MALFKPYRAETEAKLATLPIVEGQFIICEENQTLYFDKDATHRIPVGKAPDLSLSLIDSTISLLDGETAVSEIQVPTVMNAVTWNNESIANTDDAAGVTSWDIVTE